jgi:hypothetical protein
MTTQNVEIPSAGAGSQHPLVMPYFGYATFHEYWLVASQRGHCYKGKTEEQAWQSVMNTLKRGTHISSAEWIRDERQRNPKYRLWRGIWYFEMPEARATIPPELLAEVDAAMGHNDTLHGSSEAKRKEIP